MWQLVYYTLNYQTIVFSSHDRLPCLILVQILQVLPKSIANDIEMCLLDSHYVIK